MTLRDVEMVWLLYAGLAALAFVRLPARTAVAASYFGGWLLLPVGVFPPNLAGFPFQVIGSALPAADMPATKAWIAPATTLALAALAAPRQVFGRQPLLADLPMVAWCAWPLVAGALAADPSPSPLVSSLYLLGCWGAPWWLGRAFFGDPGGPRLLAEAIADAGLALVPFALIEGIGGPLFYAALYGAHPFATDGIVRYLGYRPLLLFEDGNQYGIVIAMAALAGLAMGGHPSRPFAPVRAGLLIAAALLSQSVGAILLLAVGVPIVRGWVSAVLACRVMIAAALGLVVSAPVYVSGVVPVDRLIRHTPGGQRLLAAVRATGRGSLAWRVAQDQRVLPAVRRHLAAGASRWDWWRQAATRPWGLILLIAGQFGMIGVVLAGASWVLPSIRVLASKSESARDSGVRCLAAIALVAAADALLNAFVYLPALLLAGALASAVRSHAGSEDRKGRNGLDSRVKIPEVDTLSRSGTRDFR